MTEKGGAYNVGTIFKITPSGTIINLRSLINPHDGRYPKGSLIQGADGNFYGMTSDGGSTRLGGGNIFKITVDGIFTVLHTLLHHVMELTRKVVWYKVLMVIFTV